MGRLRTTIPQLLGIKFDRKRAIERLAHMGLTDQTTIKQLVDDMESAHTREMFLQLIKKQKETRP